jgi:hypothetical protein
MTPTINLSQFQPTDTPSFLGNYNSDMQKIDNFAAHVEEELGKGTGGSRLPPFAEIPAKLTAPPEPISVEAITAGGSVNAYTLTLNPEINRYTEGSNFFIRFAAANTSQTPTININNLGTINIRDVNGGILDAGVIGANSTILCVLQRNASRITELRLLSNVESPLNFTAGRVNRYHAASAIPIPGYADGTRYVVRFAEANTIGGVNVINNVLPELTFNLDDFGDLHFVNSIGQRPEPGAIPVNSVFIVEIRGGQAVLAERLDDSFRLATMRDVSEMRSVVSGIMSANGAMNLGFRPSAVIVMSREMGGNQRAAGAVHLTPWGRNIAMAVDAPSGNQTRRDATTAPETAVTTLEITATGFNVSGMFGSHNMHPTSAAFEQHPVSAQWPLRYIAFR